LQTERVTVAQVVFPPVIDPPREPTLLERQQILVVDPRQQTFWHRVRYELVAAVGDQCAATRLLDIGAGAGGLGDWAIAHRPHIEYRFAELSPVLDRTLIERFGEQRRTAPSDPIPAGTVVVMLDVLEHIDDETEALHSIRRRMAPDTNLIVMVPALKWAFSSWDTELGHFRRYNRGTLRKVVESAGFRVERVDYLFPELLPLLVLRKLRRAKRSDVDFPQLGSFVSRIGYRVSHTTARFRRVWPLGTSVVLTATNPSSSSTAVHRD
jgi:Methyltransferase domain